MKIVTKAERGVVVDGATGLMIAKYEAQVQDLERRLLEAEALQREANDRLGTPRPELAEGPRVGEEELDEERQKRLEAEAASEERRLQIIKMEQDIALLQSQIITSHSAPAQSGDAEHDSLDAGANESWYSGIGLGDGPGRPSGPRGKRRISELAFGIGTPLAKLRGHTGSIRSFSSALETVKSPSMASLGPAVDESERIQHLEKEVEMLRAALSPNGSERREQADLLERNQELERQLSRMQLEMQHVKGERDEHIQGEGDKAGEILRLRQELEHVESRSSETSFRQHEELACLRAELDELRARLISRDARVADLENKLSQQNAEHASEAYDLNTRLGEGQKKLTDAEAVHQKQAHDLQSQLKEADEAFEKLEKSMGQSAGAARKQVEAADQRAANAEKKVSALEQRMLDEQRTSAASLARAVREAQAEGERKLREARMECAAELESQGETANARLLEAEAEQRRLAARIVSLTRDLEAAQAAVAKQSATIKDLTAELEQKQATRAAIAAMNAPPDFNSLHAKLAAVSGKSKSAGGLGNSLGSSTSSRRSADDNAAIVGQLAALQAEHATAKETIEDQRSRLSVLRDELQEKHVEMTSVKEDVRKFRADIERMDGLFQSFKDTLCASCADNMPLGSGKAAVPANPPAPASRAVERPPPPRSPFGATSGYASQAVKPSQHAKSASINYGSYLKTCSRPGTPTKNDKYGYTGLHGTPEPLPVPSDWSAQRRDARRASLAKELDGLAAARRTLTSKWAEARSNTRCG